MNRGSARRRPCTRRALGQLPLLAALLVIPSSQAVAGARDVRAASLPGGAPKIQPALHVIPFPGTPDASPHSQIIFSSLEPSEIKSVLVTGSSSGSHAGRIIKLPYHAGTAFLPKRPFAPGESVAVQAILTSPRAGTASGDPGAVTLNFSFTVATAERPGNSSAARDVAGASARSREGPRATGSVSPAITFHSRPDLHPPGVLTTADPDRSSGEIFLTSPGTERGSSQYGPMILDPRGRLVWFRPLTRGMPYNLQVQHYQGRRVLTWWQGGYLGVGRDIILNQSYGTVAVLRAAEGYYPDLHELQITPQGTALIDSYSVVKANLSSVGGPVNGRVIDCIIQELDIRTGRLLWEWHALGHVPLSASYATGAGGPGPYDFFHMNSIQQLPGGDLLISARNTWAVYKISRKTGRILWALGGKRSRFTMGLGTNFEWQHDARLTGQTLSLFDDGAVPEEEPQSSGKILGVDQKKRTAVLLRRYTHSPPLLAPRGGSMQILPNGNVFIGWGGAPDFSEYTPAGHQLFNGTVPLYTTSYRAFRFAWSGHPVAPPALSVSRGAHGSVWIYASWNGDTRVRSWRVLGGSTRTDLRALKTRPWDGFETAILVPGIPHYVAVQALDRHGRFVRSSRVLRVR